MRVLGVIPARGGSKAIPRKNIKEFAGRPLISWTIDAARASGALDRLIVSTDDEEIRRVAQGLGADVPFLRPRELATDEAPTAPVVRHVLDWLEEHESWRPELVAVLEPTSPARRPEHIVGPLELLARSRADSVATVSEVPHHYVPEKVLLLGPDGSIRGASGTPVRSMLHRRQDLARYYALNGLLFACRAEMICGQPPTLWGEHVVGYVVDRRYSLDLDDPDEWLAAETTMLELIREATLS